MIKTITRDELKQKMDRGDTFTLIDARSSKSYNKEHIKGADSLPAKELDDSLAGRFDLNEEIVVYCGNLQ